MEFGWRGGWTGLAGEAASSACCLARSLDSGTGSSQLDRGCDIMDFGRDPPVIRDVIPWCDFHETVIFIHVDREFTHAEV